MVGFVALGFIGSGLLFALLGWLGLDSNEDDDKNDSLIVIFLGLALLVVGVVAAIAAIAGA